MTIQYEKSITHSSRRFLVAASYWKGGVYLGDRREFFPGGVEVKRFTATEKWEKPWYQELPPHLKCLWQYMCDKCDAAGVWEPNWKVASMFIGKTVSESDLAKFEGRIAKLKGGKILIGSFLEFQYGKLSEECRAHIPIFRLIEKHRVSNGYSEAMHSLKEQEQEKEGEKDKEPEKETPKPIEAKNRGTLDEIKTFCAAESIPTSDAEWFFNKCVGNGWKNGGSEIKDWRATLRAWKAAHYLPSQKNGGKPPPGIKENIKPRIITCDDE